MPTPPPLPDYLPGTLSIERGSIDDYRRLASLHYRGARPATFAQIWAVRYRDAAMPPHRSRLAAVGVLSFPTLRCFARERAIPAMAGLPVPDRVRFVNRHVRTVSRVIVHPQFRSLGVATTLVRWLCEHCHTRYVEAIAHMGDAHPLFEHAGMTRHASADGKPTYYLLDRNAGEHPTLDVQHSTLNEATRSTLDVECWMSDVRRSSGGRGTRRAESNHERRNDTHDTIAP